jgi:peptidoglycan/LPS O-acetylase OafA/YrhL
VAALLYVAVERPGLRLRARRLPARPRAATTQARPAAHDDDVALAR